MTTEEKEVLDQMVKKAATALSEHTDSCRIFVTVHRGGEEETSSFSYGKGNFYAQYGQIVEWVIGQDQAKRNDVLKDDDDE